jgi:2-polyprenyl-6-methoxyphenol hydroxylase-like FAD-dependent oxidoreductase
MVVGADGTWSKVRTVLTAVEPEYTGVSLVDVVLPKTTDLSKFKRGMLVALDDASHIVMAHIFDYAHVYFGKYSQDPNEAKANSALELVRGWAPEFIALASTGAVGVARQIYALPPRMRWVRDEPWKSRVTLIGDAAHVMSPFAGEGANLALADGADLAEAITYCIKSGGNIGATVDSFEKKKMWRRAEKAAKESARNLDIFFKSGGAASVAGLMHEYFSWWYMIKTVAGIVRETVGGFLGYD